MVKLGAHMSIAGGYWKAVESAAAAGCDCVQLFTKNNNQWHAKPISAEDGRLFRDALRRLKIAFPVAHSSYLINLASPDPVLRKKSVEALVVELERAFQLGIPYVIVHPGSYTTSSEEEGIQRIVESIDSALEATQGKRVGLLLENTAGQGTNLGWKFSQLKSILKGVKKKSRIGFCLDTCHALAAGYDVTTDAGYESMIREFDQLLGLNRLKAIHLNDSRKGLGSRVDRHEHIGHGTIGLSGFRRFLHDARLAEVPMYLETEKGTNSDNEDWDVVNLRALRGCLRASSKTSRQAVH